MQDPFPVPLLLSWRQNGKTAMITLYDAAHMAGDRYLLKLFHDWLFSAQATTGRPLLDWGRVIEALNKLDAGLPERIALLSRDEATFLAVSYGDLKRCLASSYQELQAAATGPAPIPSAR